MFDELSQELESNSDLRLISSWIRRFNLSNWVESEDLTQVIESSQNVGMKTQLDDQSIHEMTAFSASTKALMSRSETLLLTVLLSRWVVQSSTDLTSCIMMKEDKSCWNKNK